MTHKKKKACFFYELAQSGDRETNLLTTYQSFTSMSTSYLYALPIELLHRIIDYVDPETIFLSFRTVCKRFYTIVNTYNQYQLDFRAISKPVFHHVQHFIQPEDIISLILSDDRKTFGQINLFTTLFDMRTFTRLRSLMLIQISGSDLLMFLKHINIYLLVSLCIDCPDSRVEIDIKNNLLSVLFKKLCNLQKLDLAIGYLIIDEIQGSTPCPIRHLIFSRRATNKQLFHILLQFPYLETLILNGFFNGTDQQRFRCTYRNKIKTEIIDN